MEAERYSLVRTIASGGMGQVYEALARGHGGFTRRVAIKRMLPELLGDDSAKQLFRAEARVASHLHHSNIVQVLDYGVVDGAEFLVLEYVDGIDGHRLVRKHGKLPVPIALHVISELAEALAYAHARVDEAGQPLGIVHRDVSAHNVLLSWEGDVKLSDFGIALVSARDALTKTGMVKGKVGYMAPEQLQGRRATPASDVYALGITLQFLVTGSSPGEATTSELAALPAEVQTLVADCTHDDPARRPSATEVAARAMRAGADSGRAGLRTFLATLRTAGHTPRSALDDLMGLALVAAGPGVFTISKQLEISSPASPPAAQTAPALVEPPPAVRPVAPPPRRRGLVAVLATLVVAAVVVLVLSRTRSLEGTTTPVAAIPRDAPRPSLDASVVSTAPAVDAPAPASPPSGLDPARLDRAATGGAVAVVDRGGRGGKRPKDPSPKDPSPKDPSPKDPSPKDPSPKDPSPKDPSTTKPPVEPPPERLPGCLSIGGKAPGWNGASIVISPDLRSVRESITAPATAKLPAGHYDVRLVGADGQTVFAREVDVPSGTVCARL